MSPTIWRSTTLESLNPRIPRIPRIPNAIEDHVLYLGAGIMDIQRMETYGGVNLAGKHTTVHQ